MWSLQSLTNQKATSCFVGLKESSLYYPSYLAKNKNTWNTGRYCETSAFSAWLMLNLYFANLSWKHTKMTNALLPQTTHPSSPDNARPSHDCAWPSHDHRTTVHDHARPSHDHARSSHDVRTTVHDHRTTARPPRMQKMLKCSRAS